MANIENVKSKATIITLNDGVERDLSFTLNAMAEIEERYGSIEKAFAALESNSIKAIRCVLWAGLLINEDEPLTEQQVGNLVDMQHIDKIFEQLGAAFVKDMPPKETGVQLPNA